MEWERQGAVQVRDLGTAAGKELDHEDTAAASEQGTSQVQQPKKLPPRDNWAKNRPLRIVYEFHEACHSVTFIIVVNSHQR